MHKMRQMLGAVKKFTNRKAISYVLVPGFINKEGCKNVH